MAYRLRSHRDEARSWLRTAEEEAEKGEPYGEYAPMAVAHALVYVGDELVKIKENARQLKREVDELMDAAGVDKDKVVRLDAAP